MNNPKGSLRELMPVAAELVDWLRGQFGKEYADKLVLQGKAGQPGRPIQQPLVGRFALWTT